MKKPGWKASTSITPIETYPNLEIRIGIKKRAKVGGIHLVFITCEVEDGFTSEKRISQHFEIRIESIFNSKFLEKFQITI